MQKRNINRNNRGIMLVTALYLTIVLVMFASAAMVVSLGQQKNTAAFYQNEAALKAAQAGLNYAMSRLEASNGWQGCTASNPSYSLLSTESGLEVYEHIVDSSNSVGCVEGKISMGSCTGYFDMYFKKPSSDSSMVFFKSSAPGGGLPSKIVLCKNNTGSAGTDVPAEDSDGVILTNKRVPKDSVLIVCRGKVGKITRTLEACFRFTHDQTYDSVIVGRGDLTVNVLGENISKDKLESLKDFGKLIEKDFDCLAILSGADSKPSIMRAKGDITLGAPNASGDNNSYLFVDDSNAGNGGRTDGSCYFNPTPKNNSSYFKTESGQGDKIPDLKMSNVAPDSKVNNISNKLKAGTYVISSLNSSDASTYSTLSAGEPDFYKKYPRVFYVLNDDKATMGAGSLTPPLTDYVDVTLEFADHIKGNNSEGKSVMAWDYDKRILTLKDSFKVESPSSHSEIKNIIIRAFDGERVGINVGEGTGSEAILFDNALENGSIYVRGQLTGTGTVVCKGDLDMEAESLLNADSETGVSIYASGSVNVNAMSADPFLEGTDALYQQYNILRSINSKIQECIKNKNNDKRQVVAKSDDEKQRMHFIDGKIFTDEEWNVINGITDIKKISYYTDFWTSYQAELKIGDYNSGFNLSDYFCGSGGRKIIVVKVGDNTSNWRFGYDEEIGDGGEEYNGDDITKCTYSDYFIASEVSLGLNNMVNTDNIIKEKFEDDAKTLVDQIKKDKKGRPIRLRDTIFRGLVFSCKNFVVNTPDNGFQLEGGLVAYGGDPESGAKDTSLGNITINARDSCFTYNNKYLSMLQNLGSREVDVLYWAVYKN